MKASSTDDEWWGPDLTIPDQPEEEPRRPRLIDDPITYWLMYG